MHLYKIFKNIQLFNDIAENGIIIYDIFIVRNTVYTGNYRVIEKFRHFFGYLWRPNTTDYNYNY